MTKEQLLAEVMKLDPTERNELAEDIRQRSAPDLTPEQIAEVRRRAAAIDRGDMGTVPGEQVMRELFERLGLARRNNRPSLQ
jgi:putative addiction module component (TIGR02574 family)